MTTDAQVLFSDPEKTAYTINRFRQYLDNSFQDGSDFSSYVVQQLNAAAQNDPDILNLTGSDDFSGAMSDFYNSFTPDSSWPPQNPDSQDSCPSAPDLGPDAPWFVETLLGGGAGLTSDLAGKAPYLMEGPLQANPITGIKVI